MFHGTTIICMKQDSHVVMGGDGQVSFGNTILKGNAKKVRKIYNDTVLAGFAGATADAFTLFERFESKLDQYSGNLTRAAVELAKDWRTDRALRRLEAILVVADKTTLLTISGTGDVIEPEDGVVGMGSGGQFALAAARALSLNADLSLRKKVEGSIKIAADICVFTNQNLVIEELT